MKNDLINQLNACLPQTQCQQCGYDGCLPYAKALATEEKELNLCLPGQQEVMQDIATLLNLPPQAVLPSINQTVYIDEMICIGCTACIKVCPVDAIVGATKLMHTIINQECTGCKLCIPACPVDCIYPVAENQSYLPKEPILSNSGNRRHDCSNHARIRFERRNARLLKIKQQKQRQLASQLGNKTNQQHITSNQNIQTLLNQAKQRAAARKNSRIVIENNELKQKRIEQEQARASFRKVQKDLRYGTKIEKQAALKFLRQWKLEQQEIADRTARNSK